MKSQALALFVCVGVGGSLSERALATPPPPETWTYVAKLGRPDQLKLPPGYLTCSGDKDAVTGAPPATQPVWKPSGVDAQRAAEKVAQCGADARAVTFVVQTAAVRKGDVKEYAFEWDPSAPGTLRVYVEAKTTIAMPVLANSKLRFIGTGHEATFGGFEPTNGLPYFTFAGLPAELAKVGGQLQILPVAVADPQYDAETGSKWNEVLDFSSNWLLATGPRMARFPKPQRMDDSDVGALVLPKHPLDRFVEAGAVECGGDKQTCVLSQSAEGLLLQTAAGNLETKPVGHGLVSSLDLPTSTNNMMQATGGHLVKGKLSVRLGIKQCLYDLTQLTRVEGGRTIVQTLFGVTLKGDRSACSEDRWQATLKKTGAAEAVATGTVSIAGDIATVTWESLPTATPNAATTYDVEMKYRGGQLVDVAEPVKLFVNEALAPTANLRAFTSLRDPIANVPAPQWLDVTARKSLAVARENVVELGALRNPGRWTSELIGAGSYFPGCPDGGLSTSVKRICVNPPKGTTEVLQLRLTETAPAQDILLPGIEVARLGAAAAQVTALGSVDVNTGLSAKPYLIAQDLEAYVKVKCGTRIVDAATNRRPASVNYDAFEQCHVVFDPTPIGLNAKQFLSRFGTQFLIVTGGPVPKDNSAPKLETLLQLALTPDLKMVACPSDGTASCYSFPLNMLKASGGEAHDYTLVQIEVKHVQDKYELTAPRSKHDSELVVRIRRRPEWLTLSSDRGNGARAFFTVTTTPFTLFRAPHSGRKASKSSEVAKLEAPSFGAGLLAVGEFWDFDTNTPPWPFLTPQLHFGVVSTVPSSSSLSYPTVSIVFGGGLRTGVDTAPDAKVESSLKILIWGEHLWTLDDRREESQWNLLFGLGVDVGSFGN